MKKTSSRSVTIIVTVGIIGIICCGTYFAWHWIEFSRRPQIWKDLAQAVHDADGVEIEPRFHGADVKGVKINGAGNVLELLNLIELENSQEMILGLEWDHALHFTKGENRLLTLHLCSERYLRWRNGKWQGDVLLTPKAQEQVPTWFKEKGYSVLQDHRESMLAWSRSVSDEHARFVAPFPPHARKYFDRGHPDAARGLAAAMGDEVALVVALCRALGTLSNHYWSGGREPDWFAVEVAKTVTDDKFFEGLIELKNDRQGLHGAAKLFFSQDFSDKVPREVRPEWAIRLAEVVLTDGADANKARTVRHLQKVDSADIRAFLHRIRRGEVGKEIDREKAKDKEPGIRAGAALVLAKLGEVGIGEEIHRELALCEFEEDRAAYEVGLALLGDPTYLRTEHFKLPSYSIGLGGLEAIERFKGKHGMEALVEGAMRHPWGLVAFEAVPTFQRATGLELDSEEIQAWWAINNGREPKIKLILQCSKPLQVLGDRSDYYRCAHFSPDGKYVIAGTDSKTAAQIWDAKTGKVLKVFSGQSNTIYSLAFNPSGERLATASHQYAFTVWDTKTWEIIYRRDHKLDASCVAYSLDSKLLASGSRDTTAKTWDAATGKELATFRGHNQAVQCVAFSADSMKVVSTSWDGTLKIWNARTAEVVLGLKCPKGHFGSVACSTDGKYLAATGGDEHLVTIWDAATGAERFSFIGRVPSPTAPAFSPDNRFLAAGSWRDKTVTVWDLETAKEKVTFKAHTAGVLSVNFSPDGTQLVTASADKTVKIWDLASLP